MLRRMVITIRVKRTKSYTILSPLNGNDVSVQPPKLRQDIFKKMFKIIYT